MGVSYSANYGIGIQVKRKEFSEEDEYYGDFVWYVDDLLVDTEYDYFEVGDGNYTGKEDEIFICIEEPFEHGFCAAEKEAEKLITFLEKNEIEYIGKVGLVGGLRIS